MILVSIFFYIFFFLLYCQRKFKINYINNLNNLNITLSENLIKRLVYEIKDSYFPKDEDFLNNISLIKITFDSNDEQLIDKNFCFAFNKYINRQRE